MPSLAPAPASLDRQRYVAAVIECYLQLPHTPNRATRNDRRVAENLCDQNLPLDTVKAAFLLATSRRTFRPKQAQPLEPIRSLAYFLPVIAELQETPIDPVFVQLVRARLHNGFPHLEVPPLDPPIPW